MGEQLQVIVEIPRGSRNKYEWDEQLQAIKLDRFLFSSMAYPTDYGFFPQTLAEDGDPLDAMVSRRPAEVPRLPDPGQADRPVSHERRRGPRRQGALRPVWRPDLA